MWKLLNLKWDVRTMRNILLFPIIISVRTPMVLLFWLGEYLLKYMEYVIDTLPGWDS